MYPVLIRSAGADGAGPGPSAPAGAARAEGARRPTCECCGLVFRAVPASNGPRQRWRRPGWPALVGSFGRCAHLEPQPIWPAQFRTLGTGGRANASLWGTPAAGTAVGPPTRLRCFSRCATGMKEEKLWCGGAFLLKRGERSTLLENKIASQPKDWPARLGPVIEVLCLPWTTFEEGPGGGGCIEVLRGPLPRPAWKKKKKRWVEQKKKTKKGGGKQKAAGTARGPPLAQGTVAAGTDPPHPAGKTMAALDSLFSQGLSHEHCRTSVEGHPAFLRQWVLLLFTGEEGERRTLGADCTGLLAKGD